VPVEGQEGQTQRALVRLALDPERSALQQLRDPSRYPEITATARQLTRIRLYRDWSFGPESRLRRGQSAASMSGELLDEDAANLGLVLHELRTFPDAWRRVKSAMALLYTGCDDLHVSFAGGTVQLFVLEGERRHKIPASRASDGTLRYLALVALLCHPSPPPLLCIDEPELGLHPYLMSSVASMLREASQRTQVVVSTHSAGLLAALGDLRGEALVFERGEAGTVLRRGLSDEG
jgi:predicted ATPase